MPAIFVILIAIFATTLTMVLVGRPRPTARTQAVLMMTSGFGLITFGVFAAIAAGEALPAATGVVGVVFIALGARRLRVAS